MFGRWTQFGMAAAGVAAAAAVATAADGPVAVAARDTANGARVELTWPNGQTPPGLTARVAGGVLLIEAESALAVEPAAIARQAPKSFALARRDGGGRALRISLRRDGTASVARSPQGHVVTFAASATPAAAETVAPSSSQPRSAVASLTIGERPDFTRLAFLFPGGATVTPIQTGDRLDLRFSRAAEIDIARLNVSPPKLVRGARIISRPGERLAISLTLEAAVKQRHFVDGSRVIVDLTPAPVAAKPQAASVTPAPPRPGGTGRITFAEDPTATTFGFQFAAPVRAAAFRRGDAIYVLFDAASAPDVRSVARVGRRHTDVTAVTGDGVAGVRIGAPPETLVSARADGAAWRITLAQRVEPGPAATTERETAPGQSGKLVVKFGRDGVVRWIEDPSVGDRIAVALVPGSTLGVNTRRATLEAAILPAAHGAAAEVRADGVGAAFENGAFVVSRGGGLIASTAQQTPDADAVAIADAAAESEAAAGDMLLALNDWSKTKETRVVDAIEELERRAAKEGTEPGAPSFARMALAKFLLAHELAPEALGALRVASVNQPQLEVDPQFRLMRAAAAAMMGRFRDAQADLAASGLQNDPGAALWRGYVAAQNQNWPDARRALEAGRSALGQQPRGWRVRFNLALAEAALSTGDLAAAEAAIAAARGSAASPDLTAQVQLMQARLAKARGDLKGALAMFEQIAKARDEASAVRASLEIVRIRRELQEMTAQEAVDALEALRFRWRGDGIELETIQALGHTYSEMNRWREGLSAMRVASMRFGSHPTARRMRVDMGALFERLFLDGEADKLEPIQALGLFYEFRDLAPFGPDGDRMIRLLAARLIAVDLLDKAAELMKHQVENRLEGLGQAQIAVDLAAIYMQDGKYAEALDAINTTRQPRLPPDLIAERRIMEANALLKLGRFDHAVEIVEKDRSPDGQRIRAEAAWRQKEWSQASAMLAPLLPSGAAALTPDERRLVLRAAMAAVYADDTRSLAALERRFGARMQGTPEADAFEVIASDPAPGDSKLADAARMIARTDLMDRFMAGVRARLSEGGAAPATAAAVPAPPTPPRA